MSAEIDDAMPARKHVEPDDKIGLNLTAAERDTILEDVVFLDDDYEQVLCETPIGHAIEFTRDDWDYLGGEIYFEAEEADNPERGKRLLGICARIEGLLAAYCTHGEPD